MRGEIQQHHPNYDNPLLVVWLCSECHQIEHHPPSGLSGLELKKMRLDLGFSQRKLAKALQVSAGTVGAWERGVSPVPLRAEVIIGMIEENQASYRQRRP